MGDYHQVGIEIIERVKNGEGNSYLLFEEREYEGNGGNNSRRDE